MKSITRLVASMAIAIVGALTFFGIAEKASAAYLDTHGDFNGFAFDLGTFQYPDEVGMSFEVTPIASGISVDGVNTMFWTNNINSSIGYMLVGVSGRKNVTLVPTDLQLNWSITLGGVTLTETAGVGPSIGEIGTQEGYGVVKVGPGFELRQLDFTYGEYTFPSDGVSLPETHYFYTALITGQFVGADGAARGLPFVRSVPTPGACSLLGLSGLVSLRRHRR